MDGVAEAYAAHHSQLTRFLVSRIHDGSLAEDLSADVWERACRHADRIHDWQPWLYQVARRLVIDYHRRPRPVPLDANWQIAAPADVEGEVLTRMDLLAVRASLPLLTRREREAVTARAAVGSVCGAAAVTGHSRASVATAICRGKAKLRGILDGTLSPLPKRQLPKPAPKTKRALRPPRAEPPPTLTAPCVGCGLPRSEWPVKRRRDARFHSHACGHLLYMRQLRVRKTAIMALSDSQRDVGESWETVQPVQARSFCSAVNHPYSSPRARRFL